MASGDGGAGGGGEVGVEGGEALGYRAGGAVADGAAVDGQDRGEAAHRAGHERLLGVVELGQRVVADLAADPGRGGQFQDGGPGDALRAGRGGRCASRPPVIMNRWVALVSAMK